jgi:short-subunit dehydrogenase
VLVARARDRLEEVAAELRERHRVETLVLPTDLADPAGPAAIVADLARDAVEVDVLVNSAGFGGAGRFVEQDIELQAGMVQVNVASLTRLTRLLLPGMVARGRGRVLNVASTAAFQAGPLQAVYYASKAYVLLLSEALASELDGTGVTVTCLCPGPTATGFGERAGLVGTRLFSRPAPAEQVAADGYRALKRGDPLVITGFVNRAFAFGTRLVPRRAATAIARKAQERA